MLTNEVSIVYIDDIIQPQLSKYLDKHLKLKNVKKSYAEIEFKSESMTYEDLLNNKIVQEANLIIVDSRLFENKTAKNGKFTGEEFKLILKKEYPYINVIIITQNIIPNIKYIKKYSSKDTKESSKKYYDNNLKDVIEENITEIIEYRNIAKKLTNNAKIDKFEIEKILNVLEGKKEYDKLSKKDIDNIILNFQNLERAFMQKKKK